MNKTVKSILIPLLVVILVGSGIFVGINWNNWFGKGDDPNHVDDNARDWEGEKDGYTGQKNTDTIDIPGYGSIMLKADTAEQTVSLHNPEQNTCYFKLALLHPDGTRLWQSDLIEPGKGLYDIVLEQTLPAGTYEDAVLKYECFTMSKEQAPLNGSEIKLTLEVLE